MTTPAYIPDRPAESDALGRAQFAKSLAKALLYVGSGDGLVVGIEGGWGSGKSTIIEFAKKELLNSSNTKSSPIVVDFNPWMVSNTGALVDALVTQIAAAINFDSDSSEVALKAGEKLLGYVGLIKHLKYLKYVPGMAFAGNAAEDISQIAESVGDSTKNAHEALDDVKKLLPALDLSKKKAEVVVALRDLGRQIVVIVDDIDRLPADEIRTVVQAIKAVADFPETTYLLAYDRDVVAAALGNGNKESGLSYLEKIVQVAYPIPPLFEYQLRGYVDEQLKKLLSQLNIQLRDYEASVYEKAILNVVRLGRHPRDIVRLMNRLMMSLPATHGEVNTMDVIVFEALSQRFPYLRENVHRYPTDFTGYAFRGDFSLSTEGIDWDEWIMPALEPKSIVPSWEKHLPQQEIDQSVARKACAFLFPQSTKKGGPAPEDELRIVDPDRLARYFRMTSLDSVPEARDICEKLTSPKLLAAALESDDAPEVLFVLEWIYNYLPSCSTLDVAGSIKAIVECAVRAQSEEKLSTALAGLLVKILERIIRKASRGERSSHFLHVVSKLPLFLAEKILLRAAAELGKWSVHPEMIKEVDAQLISDDVVVERGISLWSERVRQCVEDGTILNEPEIESILYRFAQLNFAYAETYELVAKITSTEKGLSKFLGFYSRDNPHASSVQFYGLVENAEKLAEQIRASSYVNEYSWLANLIGKPEWAKAINDQAIRYKEIKRRST